MEYGFENFEYREVFDTSFHGREIPVSEGQYPEFPGEGTAFVTADLKLPEEEKTLRLLLGRDEQVEVQYLLPEALEAPVEAGQEVGSVKYSLNGTELAEYPLYAASGAEKVDYLWCLEKLWERYCCRARKQMRDVQIKRKTELSYWESAVNADGRRRPPDKSGVRHSRGGQRT